jgi:hypothetical protein
MSVYQIVYCSRNRITGSAGDIEAGIAAILATARTRNQRVGISGALLFNGSAFAQVLEGPLDAVEEVFEAIQCDDRHSDVVILRTAEAKDRVFSDWSMAYADPGSVHGVFQAEIDLDEAFANPLAGAPRIVSLLEHLVIHNPA